MSEPRPAPAPVPVDLAVVGAGPAGRAVTLRALARGLTVALIDPAPDRPWPASYGAWVDELPGWLPDPVVAARMPDATAVARTTHRLGREYVMLSTAALQTHLSATDGLTTVEGVATDVQPSTGHHDVVLRGGRRVPARAVVDASGWRRVVSGGTARGTRATQTAVGVVLTTAVATQFMDWRDDHGEDGWPTFLYTVPLGGGRTLLEETSLARRPGLPLDVLRRRLDARLRHRDIEVPTDAHVERVSFPVDTPLTRGRGVVVPFGAAAPLVHPATGYSLATALSLVDPVLDAIVDGLPDGRDAAAQARRVLWPAQAVVVHHLRRRGLEALLSLPSGGVVDFFELFFGLAPHHQRAYLSERGDAGAVMAAMLAVFAAADGPLRRHLVRWGGVPVGRHHAGVEG